MPEAEKSGAAQSEVATLEPNAFSALLQKEFRPQSDRAKQEVDNAVKTLAELALRNTTVISADVVETIKAMIASLDRKLSEQVNHILHNADFQKLEGAWRGLHHLV